MEKTGRARGGGAGLLRLVRRRFLVRQYGNCPTRGMRRGMPRREWPSSRIPQLQRFDRTMLPEELEGVDDLVVVAVTQDAVLVSRQKDANGWKRTTAKLKTVVPQVTEGSPQGAHRPRGQLPVGRQWRAPPGQAHHRQAGQPGSRWQKHHHRSEHWIVVRGVARVTANDLVKTVHENESDLYPARAQCTVWKIPGQDLP